MFAFLKQYFTENLGVNSMASILHTDAGFGLFDRSGELIQTYGRRRDAVRGAARRGLELA